MNSKEFYKIILEEYAQLQQQSINALETRKAICYKKCSRIKEIDEELNQTGIKIAKALILSTPEEKANYLDHIKLFNEKLKQEKINLLIENGFEIDFFKSIYFCEKCEDTGFINNEKCICFKQKLINQYYKQFDFMSVLKNSKFSDFSPDYYKKEIEKGSNQKISDFDNIQHILKVSKLFVEEFGNKHKNKNIIFEGQEGRGKTFLCHRIAKEVLNKGYSVLYMSSFRLFNLYERRTFSKDISEIEVEILDMVLKVDLLVIDDLGTEFINSYTTAEVFNIINSRLLSEKSTIISTNLSPDSIGKLYSMRLFSRIFGEYERYELMGEDIRFLKNKKINNTKKVQK